MVGALNFSHSPMAGARATVLILALLLGSIAFGLGVAVTALHCDGRGGMAGLYQGAFLWQSPPKTQGPSALGRWSCGWNFGLEVLPRLSYVRGFSMLVPLWPFPVSLLWIIGLRVVRARTRVR